MKPVGEVICHHRAKYHQSAYDTQEYIFTPGELSDANDVLAQAVDGNKQTSAQPYQD